MPAEQPYSPTTKKSVPGITRHRAFSSEGQSFSSIQHRAIVEQDQHAVNRTLLSLGGQLFLCIVGGLISLSIGVAILLTKDNNRKITWRRLLFALGAAVCSLLFVCLAIQSVKRANRARRKLTHRQSQQSMLNKKWSRMTHQRRSTGLGAGAECHQTSKDLLIKRTPLKTTTACNQQGGKNDGKIGEKAKTDDKIKEKKAVALAEIDEVTIGETSTNRSKIEAQQILAAQMGKNVPDPVQE